MISILCLGVTFLLDFVDLVGIENLFEEIPSFGGSLLLNLGSLAMFSIPFSLLRKTKWEWSYFRIIGVFN